MDKQYFTFVFCSSFWSEDLEELIRMIDWLCALVSFRKLDVTAQIGQAMRSAKIMGGNALREWVESPDLKFLTGKIGSSMHSDIVFTFENKIERGTPEYIGFLDPYAPRQVEEISKTKIFSFSIRGPLWKKVKAGMKELIPRLAEVFLRLGCEYGYGTETDLPITSSLSYPPGKDPTSGFQIREVDYSQLIDGVYPINFIGMNLLALAPELENWASLERALEVKFLNADGGQRVMVLSLDEADSATRRKVSEKLSTLLPGEPPRGIAYLLIPTGELKGLGGFERLRKIVDPWEVTLLPDGAAQVMESEVRTIEQSMKRVATLQKIYGYIYPEVARGDVFIHERMESLPGLFAPNQTFSRVANFHHPGRAVLFYLGQPSLQFERLPVHFLTERQGREWKQRRVQEVLYDWASDVGRNPDVYGALRIVQESLSVEFPGALDIQLIVDASLLKQEAINALVLRLDEANRDRFLVHFLIMGEIPNLGWEP